MWPENTADADIEANFLPKSKVGQVDAEKHNTVYATRLGFLMTQV